MNKTDIAAYFLCNSPIQNLEIRLDYMLNNLDTIDQKSDFLKHIKYNVLKSCYMTHEGVEDTINDWLEKFDFPEQK